MRTSVRFPARTSLEQILDGLASDRDFQEMVTRWERIPARPARYAAFPEWMDGRISAALRRRGISELYSHQAAALDSTHAGRHTVVVHLVRNDQSNYANRTATRRASFRVR